MRYNPSTPWGGTDDPQVPDVGLDTPPTRNYGDLIYNLPDLAVFRALDHSPLSTREDYDSTGVARPFTRRLLGALTRDMTRYSALLDQAGEEYNPARAEAAPGAAFYLRLAGYPYPAGLPDSWALALLRYGPDLWPVGRVETYLRTAEIIYGRGTRGTHHEGDTRTRSAVTAAGVGIYIADTQLPGDSGRELSVMLSGPVSDGFVRLIAALRPAAFSAAPIVFSDPSQALLPWPQDG